MDRVGPLGRNGERGRVEIVPRLGSQFRLAELLRTRNLAVDLEADGADGRLFTLRERIAGVGLGLPVDRHLPGSLATRTRETAPDLPRPVTGRACLGRCSGLLHHGAGAVAGSANLPAVDTRAATGRAGRIVPVSIARAARVGIPIGIGRAGTLQRRSARSRASLAHALPECLHRSSLRSR